MRDNLLSRLTKGFVIGASMLIPGVSGGTMAIILGIYDDLIHAVSCFRSNIKENAKLLSQLCIAGLLGLLLLSGPMLRAMEFFREPMLFFFMGAILGSLPPLYRKATISHVKPVNMAAALLGILSGTMLRFLPAGLFAFGENMSLAGYILLFGAGVVIAVALVLPGISASYVLLMLGIYDVTLTALRSFDLPYLAPLAGGAVIGTFLTADILEKAMKRHPQFTYMLIIGFMLGSLLQVFPGIPQGMQWVSCTLTFLSGLILIGLLGRRVL